MLAAGLTQGALGFGFPAISTPILALLTDVKMAIILNLLPNFTVNVISVARGGNWGASLGRYWPVALVGMYIGMRMQRHVNPATYKRLLRYVLFIIGSILLWQGGSWLLPSAHAAQSEIEQAQRLWSESPHGAMLARILPPAVDRADLPEPKSEGARLTARYCVQCHYLPDPRMHTAERWRGLVDRMVWRMRGHGNMGDLMKDMMAHVQAPTDAEVETLTRYLQKHAQKEIDPRHPALTTQAGQMFSIACSQCHALPDPQRHTAREWPAVVERMKRHMSWANVVVGAPELRTVPELKTEEIVRLLQRYARPEGGKHKPPPSQPSP